jgi:hypothetical protein
MKISLTCIILITIVVFVSAGPVCARNRIVKTDTLFANIQKKRICEMTDGEFRYFFEYQKDIDDFNACEDTFLKDFFQKEIKGMTQNEFEYFDEFILECENVVPCSLQQYLNIKDKQPFYMTNNELVFYDGCTRECNDYMEKYHPTKKQRRKKYVRIFVVSTATVMGALLGGVIYALWPHGYK